MGHLTPDPLTASNVPSLPDFIWFYISPTRIISSFPFFFSAYVVGYYTISHYSFLSLTTINASSIAPNDLIINYSRYKLQKKKKILWLHVTKYSNEKKISCGFIWILINIILHILISYRVFVCIFSSCCLLSYNTCMLSRILNTLLNFLFFISFYFLFRI